MNQTTPDANDQASSSGNGPATAASDSQSASHGECCPLAEWFEQRTGLPGWLRWFARRKTPGGLIWCNVWPSAILFTLLVQAITGLVLLAFYSPSAQTAWESVYYIQYEVSGGWLLRGIHHFSAQVLVGLLGLYLLHLVISGRYRPPRELVFWTALLMLAGALGACLTGDLLAWDENSYSATLVRCRFLLLVPGIGDDLFKLAAGGPAFGHLTLTRFLALHVGVFAVALGLLYVLNRWFERRAEAAGGEPPCCPVCTWVGSLFGRRAEPSPDRLPSYWPDQLMYNATGWLAITAIVLLLVFKGALVGEHRGQVPGDYLGVELGAPADSDPARFYAAARPEWSFRALYQLSNMFPGDPIPGLGLSWKIVHIFVLPGLVALVIVVMPLVGRWRFGHGFNIAFTLLLVLTLAGLSGASYWHDTISEEYHAAMAEGHARGRRAIELARSPLGIPASGALSLLRNDPKTAGPELFAKHCAMCHNLSGPGDLAVACETPTAPELFGFASRQWLAGLLDPEQIAGDRYFGNTRFAAGAMVRYVQDELADVPVDHRQAIAAALSAEARLPAQQAADANDAQLIEKGRTLMVEHGCTRCHLPGYGSPEEPVPVLEGYGSLEWIVGIIMDPQHHWFYGQRNDRMPRYAENPADPPSNRLSPEQVLLLARFLRQQWYEPHENAEAAASTLPPAAFLAGKWAARRAPVPKVGTPSQAARQLYRRELCSLCHSYTVDSPEAVAAAHPVAPDLGRYASAEWIRGLLDPKQIAGPKYFGNSPFADGDMVGFVRGSIKDLIEEIGDDQFDLLVEALAAEAQRDRPASPDDLDEDTKFLFEDFTCTECHKFYDLGKEGDGPDLTGYGSRQWLVEFLSDPTSKRFYGKKNHGMPSYRMFPAEPQKNLLDEKQLELLADWIRGTLKP